MKFLTMALFLGHIQADAIHDAINALKISVSKQGQQRIEKQANDVGRVLENIKDAKPVQKLEHALKKFAHTKEIHNIKKLDAKFVKSPLGKKMIKEWTDVGKVLEENLKETDNGVHFDNEKMDELSEEIDDVADTYETFFKSKWAKAYDKGWKAAFETQEAKEVGQAAEEFKKSPAGRKLKKEMRELKHSIKKNVKVTDVPEDWEHQLDMLKIEVDETGAQAIEKEMQDVEAVAKKIKHSKPV
jgi:multidrug efflux pump subunit AcrB